MSTTWHARMLTFSSPEHSCTLLFGGREIAASPETRRDQRSRRRRPCLLSVRRACTSAGGRKIATYGAARCCRRPCRVSLHQATTKKQLAASAEVGVDDRSIDRSPRTETSFFSCLFQTSSRGVSISSSDYTKTESFVEHEQYHFSSYYMHCV